MTTIDLSTRTALVTGSTRGIGLAVARALYGAGAKVAIVGRDLPARRRSPRSWVSEPPGSHATCRESRR